MVFTKLDTQHLKRGWTSLKLKSPILDFYEWNFHGVIPFGSQQFMICGGQRNKKTKTGSHMFEFNESTQELTERGTLSKQDKFRSTIGTTFQVDNQFIQKHVKDNGTKTRLLDLKQRNFEFVCLKGENNLHFFYVDGEGCGLVELK